MLFLITGAGRGIGRAVALAYAREWASLALCAPTESELIETIEARAARKKFTWPVASLSTVPEPHIGSSTLLREGRRSLWPATEDYTPPLG